MNSIVNTKKELFDVIQYHTKELRSFGILHLGVFGSFVKNRINEDSDVDLFIDFKPEYKTLKNFVGLSTYLQTLLGRKVEIVTPQSLNKFIGKYIIQEVEYVALAA
jgi:predicted nucleotidyltransferase